MAYVIENMPHKPTKKVRIGEYARQQPRHRVILVTLLFGSVVLWAIGMDKSELSLGLWGLIEGIHPLYFISLTMLSISFFIYVFQERPHKLVSLLYIAIFVSFIYLVPVILEGTARNYHTYNMSIHSQYIVDHGNLEPSIRILAYHNWPGAFVLASQLQIVTGLDIKDILLYTPLFSRLLMVPVLAMLFRTLTYDSRKVLLGLWFFFLADFVGLTYLTGANIGYIMFLLLVAMLIGSTEEKPGFSNRGARLCIIILFGGLVISHTLSPLVVVMCLTALLLYYWLRHKFKQAGTQNYPRFLLSNLTMLFGILFLAWLIFGAEYQLSIQLPNAWRQLFSVGLLQRALPQDPSLFIGSHQAKLVIAGGMVLFGGLGLVYGWSYGHDRETLLRTLAMLGSLFALMIIFFYGGEIRNRIYLYGSPFLIFLGVQSIDWRPARYALLCFLLISLPLHFMAHYGMEKTQYVPETEVTGAEWFYDSTPRCTIYLMPNSLGKFKRLEDSRVSIEPDTEFEDLLTYQGRYPSYVWINWGAERFIETRSGLVQLGWDYPSDFMSSLQTWLESSPAFNVIYNNPHFQVYKLMRGKT